ncbi:hypothetical protein AB4384_18425, partial [Vibrio sp. 10N.261.51.A4]
GFVILPCVQGDSSTFNSSFPSRHGLLSLYFTVCRSFLCGEDKYSGQSFEHCRVWLAERMRLLNQQSHLLERILCDPLFSNENHDLV